MANTVSKLPSGEIAAVFEDVTERKLAEQKIQGFSHQLLSAREHERKQLATALHHDLGSLSVGVLSRLEAVADEIEAGHGEEASASLEMCRALLRTSVAHLKEIAMDIRPPDLELLGLTTALRQHFDRTIGDSGLQIQFDDATDGRPIDEATAVALFRVGQEALTNVIRHARATTVSAQLSVLGDAVRISLQDDGRGFDTDEQALGPTDTMGLISMQEIASSLGGTAEITSSPGQGTKVVVTLPQEWEQT